MNIPRILIAAGASGSGKTLITCGILQALQNRKKKVTSFKCGPDYIDPMFHSTVIGTKSGNLDTFFTAPEITRYLLGVNAADSDIGVIEGVMGYYDGLGGVSTKASAYELAEVTDTPVIFIVNCKGMSVSILPYIQGFLQYKENSRIEGILLNQISPMLYPRVKQMIEETLPVTVFGYVPPIPECALESRHLGLVMPSEISGLKEKLQQLSQVLEDTIEIDALLKLAQQAPELRSDPSWESGSIFQFSLPQRVTIAVARDEAFCFFYEDNIRLLEEMGAEIKYFSPIHDSKLPEKTSGLILYGGYPELYAECLEENSSMQESIAGHIRRGMPVLAECGGFMYLHEAMEDTQGDFFKMAGAISGNAYYTKKLSRFGYIQVLQNNEKVLGKNLHTLSAHEFHYFDSTANRKDFTAKKPLGSRSWECMIANENQLMGFPHFHYYGNPQIPQAFLERCYQKEKEKA